jgi:hypothetical protein
MVLTAACGVWCIGSNRRVWELYRCDMSRGTPSGDADIMSCAVRW